MRYPVRGACRWGIVAGLSLVLSVAPACGNDDASVDEGPPAPERVTGLIVSIDDEGGRVTSFVVHDEATDQDFEIFIDPDVDYGFALGHLIEHEEGELPVEVGLESREGELYATEILDA